MIRVGVLSAVLLCVPSLAFAAGDAAKGEVQHRSCLQCHGAEVYVPPKRKIATLSALRKEVARWADYYNPRFSKAEIENVVAYLNRDFYRFP